MTSMLERLKNRRKYPVQINGQTVHLRPLTIGELERLEQLQKEKDGNTIGFVWGCCVLEESGEPAFRQRADGENDAHWSKFVGNQIRDVGLDTLRQVSEALADISKTPDTPEAQDELRGN